MTSDAINLYFQFIIYILVTDFWTKFSLVYAQNGRFGMQSFQNYVPIAVYPWEVHHAPGRKHLNAERKLASLAAISLL